MLPNKQKFMQGIRRHDLLKMTLRKLMVFQKRGKIEGISPHLESYFFELYIFNVYGSNARIFTSIRPQMRKIKPIQADSKESSTKVVEKQCTGNVKKT